MTKRNALGVQRRLTDVKHILEDNEGAPKVWAAVTDALVEIEVLLKRQCCPSCKHLLYDWYSHAENCKLK
jgi:hypothetical protein